MASSDDSEDTGRRSHRQRHRAVDLSLFTADGFSDQEPDPDPPDRIVLINPYTQGTIVLEGPAANLDSLLRPGPPPPAKSPHPPASGSSIESMPRVEKKDAAGAVSACAICLEEWEWAREMPCGHRFHGACAERWLRVSGSCPVCRYQMPVDEVGKKKRNRGGTAVYYYGGYGGERQEVWVRMSFNRNRDRTSAVSAEDEDGDDDDDSLDNNPSSSTSD